MNYKKKKQKIKKNSNKTKLFREKIYNIFQTLNRIY